MGQKSSGGFSEQKPNEIDKHLKIPKEIKPNRKKNIPALIRKLYDLEDNEDITEDFKLLTDLKAIEEDLFGDVPENLDYFPVRIYVRTNELKNAKQKFYGWLAGKFATMGAAHIAVQIANNVVHWFGSSFALVKDWKGKGVTALFYPQNSKYEEVPVIRNTKENREAICKVIQLWNCTKLYSAKDNNCQTFAAELLKSVGLNADFQNFEGPVGEFIQHISQYESQKKPVYPCLLEKGKVIIEWKTHEELDEWQEKSGDSYPGYEGLLKAFHRAFQMRDDLGVNCSYDAPTLLVGNDGKKIPIHPATGYTKETTAVSIPTSNPGGKKFSAISRVKKKEREAEEKNNQNN